MATSNSASIYTTLTDVTARRRSAVSSPSENQPINRSKHIPRCRHVSVLAPVARQDNGGTQFPKPRVLPPRDRSGGCQCRLT